MRLHRPRVRPNPAVIPLVKPRPAQSAPLLAVTGIVEFHTLTSAAGKKKNRREESRRAVSDAGERISEGPQRPSRAESRRA